MKLPGPEGLGLSLLDVVLGRRAPSAFSALSLNDYVLRISDLCLVHALYWLVFPTFFATMGRG